MGCVRNLLIALTLLLWVCGSVFVGLLGYLMVEDMKFKGLTGNKALDASILGVACFIFVIGFFGCLGATLRKRSLLRIFFAMLAIFMLVKIALVVVYFTDKTTMEALLKQNWERMSDEGRISIQKKLQCCGMEASESYASFNDTSCYENEARIQKRCFQSLIQWLEKNIYIVASSGGCLILIEILMLIFTCMDIQEIGRATRVVPLVSGRKEGGYSGRPMPVHHGQQRVAHPMYPNYQNEADMYLGDVYDEPPVEHSRKEWARNSYRQEWRHTDKRKR